jgi:putative transposase
MANTFFCLHYHLVFTTKGRSCLLCGESRDRIWAYLGGIAKENETKPLCIGGTEDHVHLLLEVPPKHAVSRIVQLLKGGSSKWIHDTFPDLRAFQWQDGYAIFGVSKSLVKDVTEYIRNQEEHHRVRTFGEEIEILLGKHGIKYDRRYLLD